jgi:hypothetical protein
LLESNLWGSDLIREGWGIWEWVDYYLDYQGADSTGCVSDEQGFGFLLSRSSVRQVDVDTRGVADALESSQGTGAQGRALDGGHSLPSFDGGICWSGGVLCKTATRLQAANVVHLLSVLIHAQRLLWVPLTRRGHEATTLVIANQAFSQ